MPSNFVLQVLELTNLERNKAGLEPLKLNGMLSDAAQQHSESMAEDDFFSHTGADGSRFNQRIQNAGYQYLTAGENIAAGQSTPEAVVRGWMNSPGHRANILNSQFTEIGIGYEYLANDTGRVNYKHYWTQNFGTPRSGSGINKVAKSMPVLAALPENIDISGEGTKQGDFQDEAIALFSDRTIDAIANPLSTATDLEAVNMTKKGTNTSLAEVSNDLDLSQFLMGIDSQQTNFLSENTAWF